jgi:perosamine synthetase
VYLGAKPVLVDVLPGTWCMDPDKAEKAVTRRTRAMIPVHVYGNMAEMARLLDLARRKRLAVVEDAAEALGSELGGRKAGSLGDAGVFSFHGTKTLSTGEGGMLVTSDPDLHKRVSVLANHGRNPAEKRMYFPHEVGFKYKMSNLQAAMGCAQLERVEELVEKKRRIFSWYRERMRGLPCVLNPEPSGVKNSFWLPTVVFDKGSGVDRDGLIGHMKKNGIDGRPFFYPLSSLPMFKRRGNSVAHDVSRRGMNLPSFHAMDRGHVERVARAIESFVKTPGKR